MKKELISLVIGIFVGVILCVCVFLFHNKKIRDDYIITDKETAIKIGKVLLEEHFPDSFAYNSVVLDAEETKDTWRVYNVVERSGTTEDGLLFVVYGGEISAEFQKDGKIIDISLSD